MLLYNVIVLISILENLVMTRKQNEDKERKNRRKVSLRTRRVARKEKSIWTEWITQDEEE